MSLSQINSYGIGDTDLTSMMETLDRQRRGYQAMSLRNFGNPNEPKIAAGSVVELGGALFKCESDESISGWSGISNDSDVYIKLVPSGQTATAAFTTAVPTWSDSKQGWYRYLGNERYIGGLYKDGSGNYATKWLYRPEYNDEMLRMGETRPFLEKILEIGDWNMDTDDWKNVVHGIPAKWKTIRVVSAIIRNDTDNSYYDLNFISNAGALGGGAAISSINITLYRSAGGVFDGTEYDATSYNRGWIYIKHRG